MSQRSSVKIYLLALVCALIATTGAIAQTSSVVKKGEKFSYNVESEVEITEIAAGDERTMHAMVEGIAELTARRVTSKRIEWTYSAEPVHLRVTNSIGPGVARDTTVRGTSRVFVTDAKGTPLTGGAPKAGGDRLSGVLEGIQQSMIKRWILPATMRRMTPGDSWSEERSEDVSVADIGMTLDTRFTVLYTFDGIVDTLGTRAVRVRSMSESMTIRGNRTLDGKKMNLEGDGGSHLGTSYYSTIDGMLLASRSESEVDIRVTTVGDSGSSIPMTWRQRASAMRAKE